MSAQKAAVVAMGAPTVPSVARLYSHTATESITVQRHPVQFTGTGAGYFRIWLTGALLTLITLGLYHPWAKARRLRYIHRHTRVANHALAFHGQPKRMLRGHLLMATLLAAYSLASRVSGSTGLIAALIVAGLSPALLHGAMQFKLAHTSWNGVRFHFTGRLLDAYKLVLVPAGILLGVAALSAILAIMVSQGSARVAGTVFTIPFALSLYALAPYTWWRLKRYQHNHLALGSLETRFRVQPWDVAKVFVKTALVALASMILAAGLFALLLGLTVSSLPAGSSTPLASAFRSMYPLLLLFLATSQLAPYAFFTSRMQNLVWSNTGNTWLRFKSRLSFKSLLNLSLKNAVLTAVTLGLYWPVAQMAWTRARLTAITITIHTRIRPDQVAAQARAHAAGGDASGDAAADLMGLGTAL
ncbi:MAG: DUF898 domain-containing protein [Burkholderiales bacterium]|nr:DUF898 domain-containing protein [Burkholderiales bacterium]